MRESSRGRKMTSSRQRSFAGFESNADSTSENSQVESKSKQVEKGKRKDTANKISDVPPTPASVLREAVSLTGKTVYVVDAHSLIYQVFHAMPEMTSPTGQPVGAI